MSLSGQAKVVIFLVFALMLSTGIQASEPYTFARIEPEWDEAGEVLSLSIIPDLTLANAVFRLESPETIVLEPTAGPFQDRFRERPANGEIRILESGLGEIPERLVLRLSFRPSGHQVQGGVVSFILEGETASGDPVREAIGVAVGHPGERAVRRHGALEFPAVPLDGAPQ